MKELHNHIFSNTTCISKETMLRYINKQLSKNELYEVEKHMLDCEFCSDAYEGMQFAQNSSILFAIDNQIDQRVGRGNHKAPVMRNLMVAASILVVVFGAYFTLTFFNNTVNNETELAVNEEDIPKDQQPMEESIALEDMEYNTQSNISSGKGIDVMEKNGKILAADDNYRDAGDGVSAILAEQSPVLMDEIAEDVIDEVVENEQEIVAAGNIERANKTKGEKAKQLEFSSNDANNNMDNRREDNLDFKVQPESIVTANKPALGWSDQDSDKSGESLKKEVKKSKDKSRNAGTKNNRFKSSAESSGFYGEGKLEETKEFEDRKQQNTIVIDSYKVVDYTEEYQKEYDLKNAAVIETKSVSADFESKEDKDLAGVEKEEMIVEITYKETLEKAIALYKNKKYTFALEQFDIILKEHPSEINGLFYGGLSDYHLQRYTKADGKFSQVLSNKNTEFNEEASWYKALTLIELKQPDKAKALLKGIVAGNGFYKTKAEEKLKGL